MERSVNLLMRACAICCIISVFFQACSEKGGQEARRPSAQSPEEDARHPVPKVVPYLDSAPSAADGKGKATLEPAGPLPAGSFGDFKITFTVGEGGVAAGGFVMLQIPPWWGWSRPQNQYPKRAGYIQVETSPGAGFDVNVLPLNRVVVSPREDGFAPGEQIVFRYAGRVDKFAEARELFQIFVDGDGDGHSAGIADPPGLRILAAAPARLSVTAPSQAEPGEKIELRAAPLDGLGNWSEFPPGKFTLKTLRDGVTVGETSVKTSGGEKTIAFDHSVSEEGVYFFHVEGPQGLTGKSNVMLCQKGVPHLKLYFGDIHGHSRISDGSGAPEDYYRFAREVSRLDIVALTDHADYGTIPVKGKVWERIKKAANDACTPGEFITFLGFEWTNWKYGHRNVYYRDGEGPVFRSIDPESDTPQELWSLLEPFEAMTIAHHVGGGPIGADWSIEPPPTKEMLVEICSIHGSSEYYGAENAIYNPTEGAFVRDALMRGYRLGIIASGDTHDGHPGQRSAGAITGGLVGVYSPELTREAIWDALRRRQVYGTSGPKIILNFRVGDSPMGSEIKWDSSKGPLPIALRAFACDDIASIEVIRNGEKVFSQKGDGVFAEVLIEDPEPPRGDSWYYARVVQNDGAMAWSSPVWVSGESAASGR